MTNSPAAATQQDQQDPAAQVIPITFEPDQAEFIRAVAKAEDRSIASVVRRAVARQMADAMRQSPRT